MKKITEDKLDTRSKIIETTAEIVGRESNLNITIREIANRAGVNIASINYYFRSKDKLMEEVEQMLLMKIGLIYEILQDDKESAEVRLREWADQLMKFLMDYPGILYLMGTKVIVERQEATPKLAEYLIMLEKNLIIPVLQELSGCSTEILSYKAMQLMSGVVYPVLIHSATNKEFFPAAHIVQERQKYLSLLIESIKCSTSVS